MYTISGGTAFLRRNIQGSRIGEDMIIFDDRVGKYYATGQVGGDIWDMLVVPLSKDDICSRLLAAYTIEQNICEAQVEEFLQHMLTADLIEVHV